jgi:hypothetical protein
MLCSQLRIASRPLVLSSYCFRVGAAFTLSWRNMVFELDPSVPAHVGAVQSSCDPASSRQWSRFQHARVPESLQLQERAAHGTGKCLSRLVAGFQKVGRREVHPDYISGAREQSVYKELLTYLSALRNERNVWIPTSSEVNRWWRQRREMKLVRRGDSWAIEGEGNQRARIAYASEHDGQLVYSLNPQSQKHNMDEIKNSVYVAELTEY